MATDEPPQSKPSSKMTIAIPKANPGNISVEMPMYFKPGADMASYFGGTANLQTIQDTKTPFLPVKLRPQEPNAKPIFADRAKTQTFLLHVTKKRPHGELSGSISTVTSEKFVCEGMVDYQYLASNKYMANVGLPLESKLRAYLDAKTPDDLELIPEVFSRVDLPLKYEFKQRPQYNEVVNATSDLKQVPRHFFTYANFRSDAEVPQEPLRLPKTRGIPRQLEEKVMTMLTEKFAQRPIWMRPKLFEFFTPEEGRVAMKFLPYMCYIFVNGPWRGMWVRLGYDPRKTPDAAPYQLVEIRGTRRLVSESVTPLMLLSKTKKKTHRRMPYRSRLNTVFQVNDAEDKVAMHLKKKKAHNRSSATVKASFNDEERKNSSLIIYGVPLREGFFYVQLCDLIDQNPDVHKFVQPFLSRLRKTASVWGGWYPMCMFQPIREMLKMHIVKTVGRPQDEISIRQAQIDRAVRHAHEELEARGDVDSEEEKDKPSKGGDEDEDEDDEEEKEDTLPNESAEEGGDNVDDDSDDDVDEPVDPNAVYETIDI
ncbi:unnamed protein product [Aphanomyces euteiches]|uniref:Transcription factor IIIC subunit 5 HTH domain-containing protein n=1 Tax=Aphanomyces euteiches TaxID=100861 RepID=A0A6G0XUL8_9STRA|nr:hypothetical protein Ae201684_001260 [Aphanomyces euteiches]KAH9099871.1 hypothetical protein Ae201684P_018879 [Aphanomyces euteiches]KAH9155759.1 hypothetical protein AeRB84_002288 [Aphanomyces euteiches]